MLQWWQEGIALCTTRPSSYHENVVSACPFSFNGFGKGKTAKNKMRINYRITYVSSLYNLLLPLPKKFKPLGDLFVVNLSQWILRNSEFSLNGNRHRMQPMPTFKKVERAQVIIQDGQELHLKKCAKCRAEGAEQWRIFSCSELRHVHPQIVQVAFASRCWSTEPNTEIGRLVELVSVLGPVIEATSVSVKLICWGRRKIEGPGRPVIDGHWQGYCLRRSRRILPALALVPLVAREGLEAARSARLGCHCPPIGGTVLDGSEATPNVRRFPRPS